MPKPLKVAGEVDGWCTKCRLLLNHRIISIKNGKPYQAECLTCRTSHLWRAHAPGEKPASSAGPSTRASRAGATSGVRSSKTAAAPVRSEQVWEKAIAGKAVGDFKSYNVGAIFQEGDLLRHKKFGDGVVMRVIDAHKVEVLFRDEAKTLAHGME